MKDWCAHILLGPTLCVELAVSWTKWPMTVSPECKSWRPAWKTKFKIEEISRRVIGVSFVEVPLLLSPCCPLCSSKQFQKFDGQHEGYIWTITTKYGGCSWTICWIASDRFLQFFLFQQHSLSCYMTLATNELNLKAARWRWWKDSFKWGTKSKWRYRMSFTDRIFYISCNAASGNLNCI